MENRKRLELVLELECDENKQMADEIIDFMKKFEYWLSNYNSDTMNIKAALLFSKVSSVELM